MPLWLQNGPCRRHSAIKAALRFYADTEADDLAARPLARIWLGWHAQLVSGKALRDRKRISCSILVRMGSPDSSAIGVPQAQEVLYRIGEASCRFAAPIDKLSGLPSVESTRLLSYDPKPFTGRAGDWSIFRPIDVFLRLTR